MSRAAASTTQTPAAKESALGFAERLTKLHTVAKDASASAYKFTETGNGFIFMLEVDISHDCALRIILTVPS